jgi:hypothetical protein
VKQLDWFLGAWSVKHDSDVTRRKLYGKAGAFRPKPYGVEYRPLSNFWIVSKDLRKQVWNRMQTAIRAMENSELSKYAGYKKFNNTLIEIINNGSVNDPLFEILRYPLSNIG